jgi:hypothetical protein
LNCGLLHYKQKKQSGQKKHLPLGVFYRTIAPPFTFCQQSGTLGLAVDTGIKDMVMTGDFNLDYIMQQSKEND